MRPNFIFQLLLALLAVGGWGTAHAARSFDGCTGFVTAVPTEITTPGTWCFSHDLKSTITGGTAITISTDDVTLDCNDFKLDGTSVGPTTLAYAIYSNRNRSKVRHCNIRGFYYGLYIFDSFLQNRRHGHVVEDNIFYGNILTAISVSGGAEGAMSVVRRNRVLHTGGSQFATRGIEVNENVDLIDNTVSGVTTEVGSNSEVDGISVGGTGSGLATGSSIIGNRVRGVGGDGIRVGIRIGGAGRVVLRNNEIIGDPSKDSFGCNGDASVRAKDNVINGFVHPFYPTGLGDCGNAGGNDVTP